MRTAVFSIIAPNYRHFARVLMASAQQHHPDWDRLVLLVDDAAPDDALFTTVPLAALPIPDRQRFCFRYTILELSTALKPWMFEHLFARGYDRVIYIDPDIRIYSPLAELDETAFITLTPHLLSPSTSDLEHAMLIAGTYNLGFLAVTRQPQLHELLAWWQQRLELHCVIDPANGLFVDQKWIDLVPGLFAGVSILRHEGYNVAWWNVGDRSLERLRFFHFSGFNPAFPNKVTSHNRAATFGGARRLFDDYREAIVDAGWRSFRTAPYAFGLFADGTPVPNAARIAYRNSPDLQDACGDDPFAHPELFNGVRDASRVAKVAAKIGVASYRTLSRARPLVRLVPRSLRATLRDTLLGRRANEAPQHANGEPGLNIIGYLGRDTGVGESARLCRNACETVGLPSHLIDIDKQGGASRHAQFGASVYHVNADQMLSVRTDPHAYNIGVWHWELPELPDEWIASAASLHEIWAPSAFVQSAVSRKLTIPVVHMPHGVDVTAIEPCTPTELGVPAGRFTFLCMFDFNSFVQRKNPRAAIEAFRRMRSTNAALLIKTMNADAHPAALAALREAMGDNMYLVDRALSRARVNGLIASCDAVISLHRSEGFGLILAEAMALGKPVVATGWSGNMDFMNAGNACPVGYELVPLAELYAGFQAGQHWAEPDVDHAAQLMRRLVDDDSWRAQISARGRDTIRTQLSPEAAGIRYHARLTHVGQAL